MGFNSVFKGLILYLLQCYCYPVSATCFTASLREMHKLQSMLRDSPFTYTEFHSLGAATFQSVLRPRYGLNVKGIVFRFPVEGRNLSPPQNARACLTEHRASYSMGTKDSFAKVKEARAWSCTYTSSVFSMKWTKTILPLQVTFYYLYCSGIHSEIVLIYCSLTLA